MLKAMWTRRQEWQDEAWAYYDDVPEIKYSVWYQGNVMAKARWFVGWRDPTDPEADPIPVTDKDAKVDESLAAAATAELARLRGPLGGMTEIARELNMNLEIAAEAFLVGFGQWTEVRGMGEQAETIEHPEEWDIKSVSEVEKSGDDIKIKANPEDSDPRALNKDRDTIIRIWQRHPRWSMLPDCNMRGVLGECEGLVILSNLVKAEANSRMSAGYMTLANELGQGPEDDDVDGEDGEEAQRDPLMEILFQGATLPVEDPSSAAAVAPTFIRGPAEYLKPEYLRHISIARDTTSDIEARIEARVQRLARGLNLPVEVVMGHQETTFTNAIQIEEDNYTKHFQPRLVLVADALTVGFLHPQLLDPAPDALGNPTQRFAPEAVAQLCVYFDPSDMVKQADPLQSATEGLNLDLISEETWRRLKGFSEDDKPDPTERLLRLLAHIRTFDPGISTAILEQLGVPLNIPDALPASGTQPALAASAASPTVQALLAAAQAARDAGTPLNYAALFERAFPQLPLDAAPIDTTSNGHDTKLRARALPSAKAARRNHGYKLMLIDRDLRAKLHVAANATMDRVLEYAGNKLRNKAPSELRAVLKDIDPKHVGLTYGRRLAAAAGLSDDDLIRPDAWAKLEEQFMQWGSNAQGQAVKVAKQVVSLTDEAAAAIASKQPEHLADAWTWMKDSLHDLAIARVYNPDPLAPDVGEFDPTARVPTGLVRQAVARAGGAKSLVTVQGGNPYVVIDNGEPPGGIATGDLIMGAIQEEGALVEAYEWVYGPAFRLHPFEEHESLDGEVFADFESDVLSAGDWIGDYYFPGDHDGCNCDIAPTIVPVEDLEDVQ